MLIFSASDLFKFQSPPAHCSFKSIAELVLGKDSTHLDYEKIIVGINERVIRRMRCGVE